MTKDSAQTWATVGRMTLLASMLGLGAGFCEAAFLRLTPRVSGLTEPDVSIMIWFLAPLVTSLLFAVAGFGLGVCVGWSRSAAAKTLAIVSLWGLTGAYLAVAVQLLQARSGWFIEPQESVKVAEWFAVVFAWALLALWIMNRRSSRMLGVVRRLPSRPWAITLGSAMALLAGGVICCVLWPGHQLPPANASAADPPAKPPNIVLICWDTVRADHLSAYGYSRPTSPNLDRLATQGVLFENAISPSSWTLPALSSIFTGLLPHQHGANAHDPLESSPRTLAEILRSRGYETAGFNANGFYGLRGWGIAQGFETYIDASSSFRHNLAATVLGRELIQSAYETYVRDTAFDRLEAGQLNNAVFRWFHQRSNRPFFLFVNYIDPHRRYLAPPPYDRRFGKISPRLLRKLDAQNFGRLAEPLTEDERQTVIAAYDNCLAYVDSQFGELLRLLKGSPEWSHTYLIVMSDHGDGFGEHGLYDHGSNLYRELLHVPLIIAGPGVPQGLRISHVARTREIFPTTLEIGWGPGAIFQRTSLQRYWRPGFQPTTFDDEVISEVIDYTPGPGHQGFISLTSTKWHYLHLAGGRAELYNWPSDPEEKNNLADSGEGRQITQQLGDRLYVHIGRSLRPWRGLPYLLALDSPKYSILREAHRTVNWRTDQLLVAPPVGTAQAFFHPDVSSAPPHPEKLEEELVRSIPYD